MKIAILSDTHDHIWNMEKVITHVKGKVDALIFAATCAHRLRQHRSRRWACRRICV